jgi:protein-tyrosine phosphatase
MWELEVEAKSGELYEVLKEEFDKQYVPKEKRSFTVRTRSGAKEFEKDVAVPDENTSLQFRKILKFIQTLDFTNEKIKVHCGGNSKDASVFVTVAEL